MTPVEAKRLYRAYRRTAQLLYENTGKVDTQHISVRDDATVHRIAEGAFVEMTVWIPREDVKESTLNQMQREELERKQH